MGVYSVKTVDDLIGRTLLIGITVLNEEENVISQIQVYGPVVRVDGNGIVIERNETRREFTIPPDFDNVAEAQPGEYTLLSSGEVVVNPDYISSWTVKCGNEKQVAEYSEVGFSGYIR